jgi:hypothetical protein
LIVVWLKRVAPMALCAWADLKSVSDGDGCRFRASSRSRIHRSFGCVVACAPTSLMMPRVDLHRENASYQHSLHLAFSGSFDYIVACATVLNVASLALGFVVAPLTLRDVPPAGRKGLFSGLPSANPSFRVAELGNALGYIMSRLRRFVHGQLRKAFLIGTVEGL